MGALKGNISIVVVLALVATAAWYIARPTSAPMTYAGLSPEEVDSLSRYLQPVEAAPEIDNYDMFVPAENVFSRPSAQLSTAPRPAEVFVPRTRRLTAILRVGTRPIAIIDNEQVSAGSVLPGGTEIVEIGRSEVTLREPNGSSRTLRISANAGT